MTKKLTNEEFIRRSKLVHGETYDYSLVDYHGHRNQINIICPIHGIFKQQAYVHMSGHGCKNCSYKKLSRSTKIAETNKRRTKSIETIRYELSQKYSNYDYSVATLEGGRLKNVWCPIHGYTSFSFQLHHSQKGSNCLKCSHIRIGLKQRTSQDDFLKKCLTIHGPKYDYSLTKYEGHSNQISITCPVHGQFSINANNHLNGHGCKFCKTRWKMQDEWLDSLNLPRSNRQVYLSIADYKFTADGFDRSSNTVYEFWGDYWHGNPNLYESTAVNHFGKTFGFLFDRTCEKIRIIKTKYNLIEMWEYDWRRITGNNLSHSCYPYIPTQQKLQQQS